MPDEAGAGYAFEGGGVTTCEILKGGPDKGSGVIVTTDKNLKPEYKPDGQIWEQAVFLGKGKLNFWVGLDKENPPKPEDLKRSEMIGFYSPRLGDGNEWLIPTGRVYPEGTPLPKVRRIDEEGKIKRIVKDRYLELYTAADKVWSVTAEKENITDTEEWEICRTALQANYRISDTEISMLNLLDETSAMKLIFVALIDYVNWPEFQEALSNG